jgi:Holliday-junction resolvase-like of SPT6
MRILTTDWVIFRVGYSEQCADMDAIRGLSAEDLLEHARMIMSARPNNPHCDGTPVIYVHDDSSQIYQHSKRAAGEFSALSLTTTYCVGLARCSQSPLNEYAALGRDIAAITYDEDSQQLVSLFNFSFESISRGPSMIILSTLTVSSGSEIAGPHKEDNESCIY